MRNLFLIALTQLAFTTGQEGYGKCEILGYHNGSLLQCDSMYVVRYTEPIFWRNLHPEIYYVTSEKAAVLVQKVTQKTAFCFKKCKNEPRPTMTLWNDTRSTLNSTKKNALH